VKAATGTSSLSDVLEVHQKLGPVFVEPSQNEARVGEPNLEQTPRLVGYPSAKAVMGHIFQGLPIFKSEAGQEILYGQVGHQ
jgi:hypothetical protein